MFSFFRLLRYRFFLFAGILPFFLGASMSFSAHKTFNFYYFAVAFIGIALSLVGVETFNEYFDARLGSDRVFLEDKENIPDYIFYLGCLAFILAGIIAGYLSLKIGLSIAVFAILGFIAACFYVGPPLRLAYRGFGEFAIFFAYGPLMVLGSYYVQAQRIGLGPFLVSLIFGFLILALALVNEIPDYYQDGLVGKKNLVVRLGKQRAIILYQAVIFLSFLMLAIAFALKLIPIFSILVFLIFPFAVYTALKARKTYDKATQFIPTIRNTLIIYLFVSFTLIAGYLI
ncbi:MAG: prenyltransferase [Candidatus Omnitrophota bacterium]